MHLNCFHGNMHSTIYIRDRKTFTWDIDLQSHRISEYSTMHKCIYVCMSILNPWNKLCFYAFTRSYMSTFIEYKIIDPKIKNTGLCHFRHVYMWLHEFLKLHIAQFDFNIETYHGRFSCRKVTMKTLQIALYPSFNCDHTALCIAISSHRWLHL